jgi:hypothetical protein
MKSVPDSIDLNVTFKNALPRRPLRMNHDSVVTASLRRSALGHSLPRAPWEPIKFAGTSAFRGQLCRCAYPRTRDSTDVRGIFMASQARCVHQHETAD